MWAATTLIAVVFFIYLWWFVSCRFVSFRPVCVVVGGVVSLVVGVVVAMVPMGRGRWRAWVDGGRRLGRRTDTDFRKAKLFLRIPVLS